MGKGSWRYEGTWNKGYGDRNMKLGTRRGEQGVRYMKLAKYGVKLME